MRRRNTICILGLSFDSDPRPLEKPNPIQRRLAEAFALLEHIQQQRLQGEEALLGQFIEERLIWRELLDLELQDIDEQIERICASASGRAKGTPAVRLVVWHACFRRPEPRERPGDCV